MNGDIDYTTNLGASTRASLRNNLPIRLVYAGATPFFSVVTSPEITSWDQLKGKKAGVNSFGGSQDIISRITFRYFGLDPEKDLSYIALGGDDKLIAGLQQKMIDVALIATPNDIYAKERGFNILGRASEATKMPVGGIGTTLEHIQKNPEQVKKVLRSALRGLQFIRQNKEETVKIIAGWVNLTPEQAGQAYDLVVDAYTAGMTSDDNLLLDPELVKAGANRSNLDKIRDFTLVNQVRKEMGITQ